MIMDNSKYTQKQPVIKYWLVEITLTSGEILSFYVKARNQFEANEKADGYAVLAEDKVLKSKMKQFKLLT